LQGQAKVIYEGVPLSEQELQFVRSLTYQSSHPLSKAVFTAMAQSQILPVKSYEELPGMGIKGVIQGRKILLGSSQMVTGVQDKNQQGTTAYLSIDGSVYGRFLIHASYRPGLDQLFSELSGKYSLAILSGDNNAEATFLRSKFNFKGEMAFNQKPGEKLEYVKASQEKGHKVIMVGDGLNDAGALQQSDVGISVTDNINNFSPACDVILQGRNFPHLNTLLWYSAKGKSVIIWSFILSILYNIVGLYFAFFGLLSPVVAAILMPVSSISIILFTSAASSVLSLKLRKRIPQEKSN
jgi:Cu+-exporting ATPase